MAEEKKKKRSGRVPVTLLFFRGLIGCYLVWLGWGLRKTALSGKEGSLPMLAAMILFIAVGGAMDISGARFTVLIDGSASSLSVVKSPGGLRVLSGMTIRLK